MNVSRASPRPIATEDVPWQAWSEAPRFALRYRHLTGALLGEDYRVGVAIEELAPGKQTAPAHYHVFEEEHVLVLEGAVTVRLGPDRHVLGPGGYVVFPAGQRHGHCLINESGETARYVLIGENDPRDVVVYTDSGKVLVRALGRRAIFDMAALRDYWHGEDPGLPPGTMPETGRAALLPPPETAPLAPIRSDAVAWQRRDAGVRFGGADRHLTAAAAGLDYRVGVVIEAPDPGKRLAPRHYHLIEEEHALVLDGRVTLLLGEERIAMRVGDFVSFPAGAAVAHSFLNDGPGPCRILMIGERNPADVCVYPDSRKMAVAAVPEGTTVFDMTAERGYWDGEAEG